jgi:phosphatidylglycerophosphate synthase
MTGYTPTSRRPIAGLFRRTAGGAVAWAVRARIHPDLFSYGSIVAAAIAGVLFWQSRTHPKYLLVGVAFAFVRLWLNMFDGMVALAAGKASKKGEIINDLPDRVSDVLIFVGIAHSGWCHVLLGYWVAMAALIVAYTGLFGQAVGVQREFSGLMSKPWRILVMSIGAVVTCVLVHLSARFWWGGFTALDWAFLAILLGCVQTVVVRLQRIVRALPS